jgi:hypothetical protein
MPVSDRVINEALLPPTFATDILLLSPLGAEIDDDEYGVEEGGEVSYPASLTFNAGVILMRVVLIRSNTKASQDNHCECPVI